MGRKAGMTVKKARFCEEYLVDFNATRAAIRAGYSTHSPSDIGRELLAEPEVQAVITEAIEARSKRTRITADDVVLELWTNAMFARKQRDFTASNRALELLGKHLAMFPDKLTVDFRDVATLTDEEIEERRSKLKLMA